MLLAVLSLAISAPWAAGQDKPAEKPPAKEATEPKGYTVIPGRLPKSIIRMAQSGQVGNQTEFNNYYNALIAQFTQPERFTSAYDHRKDIRRDARTAYNNGTKQYHAALNQLLLSTLRKNATDAQYHPAARFNWMLIIGDLNEVEKLPSGTAKEKPLPAALPVLISVEGDETQPDSVRLAALIGLDRHATAGGIDDAARQTLVPNLQKIVARRSPPEGRDAEVHKWFQDRARAILKTLNVEVVAAADTPDAADGPEELDGPDGPDGPDSP